MKKTKIYILLLFLSMVSIKTHGQQTDDDHLKIMSYNICGWCNPHNKDGVIDLINSNKPDIIGLQEVDSLWYRGSPIRHDVTKELSEACSMHGYFAADRYNTDSVGGGYGNATLTKNKPLNTKKIIFPLVNLDPTESIKNTGALQILEYENYVFFNTHLINGLKPARPSREEAARIINKIAEEYDKPIFLVGDLNVDPYPEKTMDILLEEWVLLSDPTKPTVTGGDATFDFILAYSGKDQNNIPKHYYHLIREEVVNNKWSDHYPLLVEVAILKDLEIKDQVISNDEEYYARNIHISNTQIQDNAVVSFNSAKSIVISPNFIAKKGTTVRFTAQSLVRHNNTSMFVEKLEKPKVNRTLNIQTNKVENTKVLLYPNPTNGILNVRLSDWKSECQINIYTLSGKLIYSNDILTNGSIIDLSSQPKGMYLAKILLNGESISQKIMLK